jgi:hypothetical protein
MISRQSYQLGLGGASLALVRAGFFVSEARECAAINMAGGRDG